MLVVLIAVTLAAAAAGFCQFGPTAGWAAACLVYVACVWLWIGRMDSTATGAHAGREDPRRGLRDILYIVAKIATCSR